MYHSIKIVTIPAKGSGTLTFDMYKDFYMVPTSLPVIASPNIKTKSVDIPGANGAIDLTESLTPYPLYSNRTGSIEFALLMNRREHYKRYKYLHNMNPKHAHDDPKSWAYIYSDLMNCIHGRKCHLYLEDDPDWYYEGRVAVSSWKSSTDGGYPTITLNYELYPYKLSINTSIQDSTNRWLWNPFSFIDGIIYRDQLDGSDSSQNVVYEGIDANLPNNGLFSGIQVNSADAWVEYRTSKPGSSITRPMRRELTGWMPVSPTFTFSAAHMGVKIDNPELGYTYEKVYDTAGTKTDFECILYDYIDNGYNLYFKGVGTVDVAFRKGSL